MENNIQDKGTTELIKEARVIKEKYNIDLYAHLEYLDLIREAYLKGYNEGIDMIKEVYKLNK
jgi:cob(I)alamin adenosyltransferase